VAFNAVGSKGALIRRPLRKATAPGQWAQPDSYGLDVAPRYFSRYFFLGGVAIFVSEGADAATFGFSFFGFLVSRLLRT
jgi:hypothetical protein